jgi:peptidoglycan/xylan/chitin deacetylase (PgdA/CDA1 family)
MRRTGFVTFSIDDGHPTDLRTADLLQKYDLKATFYIPAQNAERTVMPGQQVKDLSRNFEIGAHTRNHVRLTALPEREARIEVQDGKMWLEDLIGEAVTSFCYPGGKFNRKTVAIVEQAGFLGARTCMLNLTDFPRNPFLWGVSTHACYHSPLVQVRHALLERNLSGAWNFVKIHRAATNWLQHFLTSLRYVTEKGGVTHLFLHRWEIDAKRDWGSLERAFEAAAKMKTLRRVTNGELFSKLPNNAASN